MDIFEVTFSDASNDPVRISVDQEREAFDAAYRWAKEECDKRYARNVKGLTKKQVREEGIVEILAIEHLYTTEADL